MKMKISRRRFLTSSAAGIALMSLQSGCTSTQTTSSRGRFGPFRFGIQAHALRNFPIDEAIRIIHHDLQLHWVEFSRKHLPVEASAGEIRRVRALLKQNDITCNALGVHRFTADHDANRRVFDFARSMSV
ncbi:MAG: hypothetical protein JSW59_04720, partial [Phycisphaerales bacterium]